MSSQQQSHQRVFLVTGANMDLKFRGQKRGEDALAQLGSPLNVKVFLDDASSLESIEQAKQEIQKKCVGAMSLLLRSSGRIVNVSNEVGAMSMKHCSQDLKTRFPALEDFYLLYDCAPKVGVSILTRLKARDWDKKYLTKNVTINGVCPGFCATDLNNKAQGTRSSKLSDDSIFDGIYTENLENGQFWRDKSRLPLESEESHTRVLPNVILNLKNQEQFQQIECVRVN
ncbi:unnamed protein product [Rotaria sp. Silwood1]|nr:unnamed protein product [Rotaria sp. Silwood1]CAF3626829.1 unnamed protein product [Rotaria sp. Silwood1]CAF3652678.1 unnamed protein product [Rotaria sp. Silwood1]CAF3720125.1 unnamed protein product [Rotaria sp. Silwood1]CAF4617973.1 unnamed protein product [Rotaria sp. Silwood1]